MFSVAMMAGRKTTTTTMCFCRSFVAAVAAAAFSTYCCCNFGSVAVVGKTGKDRDVVVGVGSKGFDWLGAVELHAS